MNRPIVLILALCLALTGCIEPDPFSVEARSHLDTRSEANGRVTVLDTGGNWRFLSSAIGAEVKREAQGLPPPGATGSWSDYWRAGFSELRANQEHPEKYFALVLDLRRHSSLPDLPKESIQP